jgi:hypothetical protein
MSTDVGWLLYSTRQQDTTRLAELLSALSGEIVGVKWKPIRTMEGFRKKDPNEQQELIRALHIEGPTERAHDIRAKLSMFPDGTKMRLLPPFASILSKDNKQKFATLVTRQDALNKLIAQMTTCEFATNLLLDKAEPISRNMLRQVS